MKEIITNKLKEIESEHNIKILYACESGSRAWGFPSPDSDYDVRFIYIRTMDHYLSIEDKIDFINYAENENLDIEGWDLMKVLRLMRKSNTTIFEWLQSPVIYLTTDGFENDLWTLCHDFFCMKSNMHHYLGIAKGALDTITDLNEMKIKKLFYVLRPLLAAKWCYEKKTIAPMSVYPLLDLLPDDIKKQVLHLIAVKEKASEGFLMKIEPALLAYVKSEFDLCTQQVQHLSKTTSDHRPLNLFFRKTLAKYDH